MKDNIIYHSYQGNEPYIFFRFDKADRQTASQIINNLIERQFRICYDEHNSKIIADCEWLANRILSSELTIFLISADSLSSLEFRNGINYALNKKKNVFCIYLDEKRLEYGFDIQLANIPGANLNSYKDVSELCEDMVKTDCFSQDMRGEDAKSPITSNRRKTVAIAALMIILAIFLTAAVSIAVYRINYDNSIAGQIEKLTETDYLDISGENAITIDLLKGKTIKILVARNMGLTDIEALAFVNCEELDISQNSKVKTLEPLLENKNLKIVKVTQDMYPAITRIKGQNQFKVVITG
ncbi:MAG: TIR domain-containing protein [Christensenellales bacterium]